MSGERSSYLVRAHAVHREEAGVGWVAVALDRGARHYRAMRLLQPSQLPAAAGIARPHHREPYATVVLTGAYEAAGDAGRVSARAGEVLLRGAFSAPRGRISAHRKLGKASSGDSGG